jgi:hypothetical protein
MAKKQMSVKTLWTNLLFYQKIEIKKGEIDGGNNSLKHAWGFVWLEIPEMKLYFQNINGNKF